MNENDAVTKKIKIKQILQLQREKLPINTKSLLNTVKIVEYFENESFSTYL